MFFLRKSDIVIQTEILKQKTQEIEKLRQTMTKQKELNKLEQELLMQKKQQEVFLIRPKKPK